MFSSFTIEEAKEIISRKQSYNLDIETINIEKCLGRITAKDIISECNVPGFRRSIMDGYAVRFEDLKKASPSKPRTLKLVGEVEMGKSPTFKIEAGECGYIPTGGMLPLGADSIIIIENTKRNDDKTILAQVATVKGEYIVAEDEDVKKGAIVIKSGKKIRPYEIGVLCSIGCNKVEVFKQPKIGIISTGDEIVAVNEIPKLGQVRDINTYLLLSLIQDSYAEPVIYDVTRDEFTEIFNVASKAIKECDIVLIVGGSSVGIKDETLRVLKSMERSEILIHGLALKPGKPTIVASCDNKIVFGMPGHPLSCAVVYKTLVSFYLSCITKHIQEEYPTTCKFVTDYEKTKGREEYIPVNIEEREGKLFANPIRSKSGIITTFSKAWGYVKTDKELEKIYDGEIVSVYKL